MDLTDALAFLGQHQPFQADLTPAQQDRFLQAIDVCGRAQDVRVVPLLLGCFGPWQNLHLDEVVIYAVRCFTAEQVIPHLGHYLQHGAEEVRRGSAEVASYFPAAQLVDPLVRLLSEGGLLERLAAADALVRIGGARVRRIAMAHMADEEDCEVRQILADAVALKN